MGEDLKNKSAPNGRDSLNEIERLKECEKQKEEYLGGWQRARADFLNYKKEEMERIAELLKYGIEELILKLLPILDNFELAVRFRPDEKGFLQIKKQLDDFLKSQGVEEIKTMGEKFDPNYMEAVEKEEEQKNGYKINGRLLRPAKVKVAK